MKGKYNILLSVACFFTYSCAVSRVNSEILDPPTRSYVKVVNKINIVSCTDPKDKKCPIGLKMSAGSGIAIDLIPNETIVLTAGHVCEIKVTKAIKEHRQTVEVIDHEANIHSAWPLLISHNNTKGEIDACLLWVPSLKVKKVKISRKGPRIGQELYYIGSPAGIYHPPTVLMLKGVYSGPIDKSSAIWSAATIGGSSGSAVLNLDNEVIGVIWGAHPRFHHASIMTEYKAFLLFLISGLEKFKNSKAL